MKQKISLTIAGSDSGGGAGIQADLKGFISNNVYGCSCITCITSQNTQGVQNIFAIPSSHVNSQLNSIREDLNVDSIKIGMLYNNEIVDIVEKQLKKFKIQNKNIKIVFDPVMISTSGHKLIKDKVIKAIIEKIFPLVTLITPNIHEAKKISNSYNNNNDNEDNNNNNNNNNDNNKDKDKDKDEKINTIEKMKYLSKKISKKFKIPNILLKGGHLQEEQENGKTINDLFDVLYCLENDKFEVFTSKYIKTTSTHGTGCTLSSAIAANLANNYSISNSIKNSKKYLFNCIKFGLNEIGKGTNNPMNHLPKIWLKDLLNEKEKQEKQEN